MAAAAVSRSALFSLLDTITANSISQSNWRVVAGITSVRPGPTIEVVGARRNMGMFFQRWGGRLNSSRWSRYTPPTQTSLFGYLMGVSSFASAGLTKAPDPDPRLAHSSAAASNL